MLPGFKAETIDCNCAKQKSDPRPVAKSTNRRLASFDVVDEIGHSDLGRYSGDPDSSDE